MRYFSLPGILLLSFLYLFLGVVLYFSLFDATPGHGVILADTFHYFENSSDFSIKYENLLIFSGLNHVLPMLIAQASLSIFPEFPLLLVATINIVLVLLSIFFLVSLVDLRNANKLCVLIVLFPAMTPFLLSISKEILIIFETSLFLYAINNRNLFLMLLALVLAIFTRNIIFVVFVLLLLSYKLRLNVYSVLVLSLTCLYILETYFGLSILSHPERIQRSTELSQTFHMETLAMVQTHWLGPVVAFLPILLVNLLTGVNQIVQFLGNAQVFYLAIGMGTAYFVILFSLLIMNRCFKVLGGWKNIYSNFIILFLFLHTLMPIAQVRYYFPVFVVFSVLLSSKGME